MSIDLNTILQVSVKGGASDIHIKAGLPPMFRVNGKLLPLRDAKRLTPEEANNAAIGIMGPTQQETFSKQLDCDFAYSLPGVGRFRVNVFRQRGKTGMVLRVIPFKLLSMEKLRLPEVIKKIAEERRGLILVTGATGSGKSTTMASIVDYINRTRTEHIIMVEDPIEFLIRDKRSIVNQREVGTDCLTFATALRAALRQDPDVILVGEMRDAETIETAITAAETGHLVLSTLHTVDAAETITRIVTSFPPHHQQQIRQQLAGLVRGIISQRLVPKKDGKGRVPAIEVLVSTARIRDLIMDASRFLEITEALVQGKDTYGTQSFDQSLMQLLNDGLISYDEALIQASNPDDFALKVSGVGSDDGGDWDNFEASEQKDDFDLDDF